MIITYMKGQFNHLNSQWRVQLSTRFFTAHLLWFILWALLITSQPTIYNYMDADS